jgi:hypothetical protein
MTKFSHSIGSHLLPLLKSTSTKHRKRLYSFLGVLPNGILQNVRTDLLKQLINFTKPPAQLVAVIRARICKIGDSSPLGRSKGKSSYYSKKTTLGAIAQKL